MDVHSHLLGNPLLVGREEIQLVLIDIIHALEACSLVDGPRERAYFDLQFLFQLVQEVERVASFTVHLVDEDDDRRVAHAAYLHQLPGLSLNTLRRIHDDDRRVDCSQRTVGIFGKVLVPRRV